MFATWAYQRGGAKLTDKGWDYDEMAQKLSEAYHKAALENNALIADVGRRFYEWSIPRTSMLPMAFIPVSWALILRRRPLRQ